MRVLLDECVPRKLRRELPGHAVSTVVEMGWGGKTNGALLRLAGEFFDVFLTVDTGLEHQQNRTALPIAIVVLEAVSNDIDDLMPLAPRVRELIEQAAPGQIYRVSSTGPSH